MTKMLYLCNDKSIEFIEVMKWNEMKRLVIAHGFYEVGHRGKHDEYYNPETKQTILLERHWSQEVRPGIMKRLLKQIGA